MRFKVIVLAVASLVLLAVVRFVWMGGEAGQSRADDPRPTSAVITAGERARADLPASLRGLRFEDVTSGVGLDGAWTQSDEPTALASMTAGTAVTSRAGRPALLLTSERDPVRFVQWRSGRFVDITGPSGLARAGAATAALFADLDGDGDDDLVLGHQGETFLSVWRNTDGRYRKATREFGFASRADLPEGAAAPAIRGVAAADVDGDGQLDIVVTDVNPTLAALGRYGRGVAPDEGDEATCDFASQAERNAAQFPTSRTRLYLGRSDGTYRDRTTAWHLDADSTFANTPLLTDVDGDGRVDLLVTGASCTSRVLHNTGRRFETVRWKDSARVPQGHGAVFRDLDGDGQPDWLVTGVAFPTKDGACPALTIVTACAGNSVLRVTDDRISAEDQDGLGDAGWAFGAAAEDFANTGDLQVAVTNGFTAAGPPGAAPGSSQWDAFFGRFSDDPMALFARDDHGRWVDVAAAAGVTDTGAGRSLLAFDYDGDGRLDLFVNNADTGPRLLRNESDVSGRHWVRIALDDRRTATNRAGWGARVRVTAADGRSTECPITSNTSYETASPGTCHVGLGAADGPVTVRVWWPGSTGAQTFDGVGVDREVVLRR